MHFAADEQLGPYKIKFLIGKGGMGEVYRAWDTVLKREVALKVLPAEFAPDPDRAARFQREAQLLASLNHPHIATLHGLERSDGMTALVMELVDGPTLAERIAQGPIPSQEAFEIARQIAEALEYAHERGVIHRDLKPANVKLTPDDKVKLLDFGLAKALEDDAGPAASQDSPTLTLGHTRAGVILGTAGYMAPEQVMGKRADRRADIWAFGVVLYEMLTGKRLFTGENTAEILASVVKDQPSLEGVPVGVRPMLARCLEKDRRRRLQAIGEARIQIEDGFPEAAPAPIPPRPWWAKPGPWAALAGMGVLAAGAIGFVHFREAQPELHRVQFEIVPPGALQSDPVLSPDGRHVAFVARGPNRAPGLWVRSLDSVVARELPSTEGAVPVAPFWSADGRSLGFVSGVDATLKRIDIAAGPPQTICGLGGGVISFGGGTWNADGTIIFAMGRSLWRVPQAAGTPAPLTEATEGQQVDPHFMPDGKHFVYREGSTAGGTVYLAALDSQQRVKLVPTDSLGGRAVLILGAATVGYAPPLAKGDSGHLLFIRGGALMAQAMDPKTYALSSEPISVADRVEGISVSNNGTLAYRTGDAGGNVQLMWFDREGKPEGTVGPPGVYNDLAISPDGKRVAVTRFDSAGGTLDLWMIDIERGVPSRFTSDPGMDWEPVWSPDSRTVAFTSDRVKGINAIYTKDANNVGTEQPLIPLGNDSQHPKDWSPDGKLLIITQYAGADGARGQLWVLPLDGDRKPVPFLTMPYLQSQGQFYPIASRGPRWVAYISNETGRNEVYVQSYPPGSGKVQVSSEGGVQPRWRRDGKELFYIAADGKLMAAEVKRALVTFEIGASKALFQTRMLGGVGGRTNYVFRYDVAADGKRFLIVAEREGETQPITVVLNWAVAVKK